MDFRFFPLVNSDSISCNSSKKRKEYLVLTCGPPSLNSATPKGKGEGEGEESYSSDDNGSEEDEDNQTVCIYFYI